MGINRNIVECKYDNYGQKVMTTVGINRNIVECKLFPFVHLSDFAIPY